MFSKLALTEMWIHFFKIFLGQKVSAKKNTAILFLHQNGKTAQNLPSNWFSDGKPEIPLHMFSKLALTDMLTWALVRKGTARGQARGSTGVARG